MSKMIQVRNVPEGIHRTLKSRAALEGLSLSDYLLRELKLIATQPTLAEMSERLRRLPRVTLSKAASDLIREERDAR